MRQEEKKAAASQLLMRLAQDEGIRAVSGAIHDMDGQLVRDLLLFAAHHLDPPNAPTQTELIVHVDGASIGNPGPSGAGVVILDAHKKEIATISQPLGAGTNNVAEYRALILGLARARALGALRVHVRGDSELMVKQINGEYRIKDEKLQSLAREAMEIIDSFDHFDIIHVDREENGKADRLAKRAAEKGNG